MTYITSDNYTRLMVLMLWAFALSTVYSTTLAVELANRIDKLNKQIKDLKDSIVVKKTAKKTTQL